MTVATTSHSTVHYLNSLVLLTIASRWVLRVIP